MIVIEKLQGRELLRLYRQLETVAELIAQLPPEEKEVMQDAYPFSEPIDQIASKAKLWYKTQKINQRLEP
jgi:hypothetical protein